MLKTALGKGLTALTPVAIVKVIVVGVAGLVMTAMAESVVEDAMTKKKRN